MTTSDIVKRKYALLAWYWDGTLTFAQYVEELRKIAPLEHDDE